MGAGQYGKSGFVCPGKMLPVRLQQSITSNSYCGNVKVTGTISRALTAM